MITCRTCSRRAASLRHAAYWSFLRQNSSLVHGHAGSFVELGLPPSLTSALARSFPHVQEPTDSQAAILRAFLPQRGQDVKGKKPVRGNASSRSFILRDVTGSGKSLALLLAMLAQKRSRRAGMTRPGDKARVEQLLLVPHTELARQFEYWLEALQLGHDSTEETQQLAGRFDAGAVTPRQKSPSESIAQVIYRGTAVPQPNPLTTLLISTPNALVDVLQSVDFSSLHTIALDEADSMLSLPNRFSTHQEVKKWQRHPPVLIALMRKLLSTASSAGSPATVGAGVSGSTAASSRDVRLVAVSATANSVFRDWMVRRSGWIGSKGILGEKQIDWYDFSDSEASGSADSAASASVYEATGKARMPQESMRHYVCPVDHLGNLCSSATSEPQEVESASASTSLPESERLMLAVATLFAEEQVVSGLMVIGSGQSLTKTLEALRELGVPATTIQEGRDLAADEPRLYVHSVDAVRGLDVPSLSHVFLLPGLAEDAATYLHVAGRVGRLTAGRSRKAGKVICLVDTASPAQKARVARCWELLGVRGSTYGEETQAT